MKKTCQELLDDVSVDKGQNRKECQRREKIRSVVDASITEGVGWRGRLQKFGGSLVCDLLDPENKGTLCSQATFSRHKAARKKGKQINFDVGPIGFYSTEAVTEVAKDIITRQHTGQKEMSEADAVKEVAAKTRELQGLPPKA